MNLKLVSFTKAHAKEVFTWKYSGEYAVYNYPSWEIACKEKWAITILEKMEKEFSSLIDKDNNLCGYIRLQEKDEYVLLGLGLKPSLCGIGIGKILIELVKSKCNKLYGDKKIGLEVRAFNVRAIKLYEWAGFKIKETYSKNTPIGYGEFIMMELNY